MGDFQKVVDDKRAEFVSFREVLDKLAADTGDGLKTIAEALRIKRIHWEGGARYKPGILIDGGTEEEPLGMLLEQTAETGLIPERCGWLAGSEWGPDNIGWHRAELVERLRAAGLPSPCSLLVTSEQYAPTTPPSASEPAVELTQAESAAQVMPVAVGMPAPEAIAESIAVEDETQGRNSGFDVNGEVCELAALFDPVRVEQLEAMFPSHGKWSTYANRAARNGLGDAARIGKAKYNPYLAALWWLDTAAPQGWKLERCMRVLANNLPARSMDSKHLLVGDIG